jgi:hypothetical protein
MRCEHCNIDSNNVRTYAFWYGKLIHKDITREVDLIGPEYIKTTINHYKIKGCTEVDICDKCLIKPNAELNMLCGSLVVFITAYAIIVSYPPTGILYYFLVLLFGCLLLIRGLIQYWKIIKGHKFSSLYYSLIKEKGDKMAIRMFKASLEKEGYDAFFSTAEHKKLMEY